MSDLEEALRRRVIAEVYRQADELDWDGLSDKRKSAIYDRWLDDPGIGQELTRFQSRERVRVWLKDVPMKEYNRARSGIGAYSDLVTTRLPGPGQIARQVLGSGWNVVEGTIRDRPNRCSIRDSRKERLLIWGPPKALRDLVWAGISSLAQGSGPPPLVVVAFLRGDVLSEAERQRHVRIGEIAGLEVRHTTLNPTRVTPRPT